MEIVFIILAPLLAIFFIPWLARLADGKWIGPVVSLVPFSIAAWLTSFAWQQADPIAFSMPWLPSMDVSLSFLLDSTSLLFIWLVSFIGGLICIYGGSYLHGDRQLVRFFVILMVFMSSMFGVIAADDVIVTFVFWELTSITSFLLVGYKHTEEKARKAALQALLITGGGGLALLCGLLVTAQITGSTRISDWVTQAEVIGQSSNFPLALGLILLGVFTKSAQFPFHFWLPGAMAAPTPVSAFLHSATMVKVGVILLVKLSPAMAHTDLWGWLLTPFGAATMLTGAIMAIIQEDLKRLLAYSTVSVLGMLVMLLGFGDAFSLKTALFLVLVHGFYKGALFMIAGTIDHSTGTRDVTRLDGLGKAMPLLAFAAALAAFSMSGVPPSLGFISKELLYEKKLDAESARLLLVVIGVFVNSVGVAVAMIVGIRPFIKTDKPPQHIHMPGRGLVWPPTLLAVIGMVLGCMPSVLDRILIAPAVLALGSDPKLAKLTLWHGFTPVLALSVLTLLLGVAIYAMKHRIRRFDDGMSGFHWLTPSGIYQFSLNGVLSLADRITRWIQHGSLIGYAKVTVGGGAALIIYAIISSGFKWNAAPLYQASFFDTFLLLLMAVSSVVVNFSKSRLMAILAMGGVGYSISLWFVAFGAPDLAITQLLVETLTVVLFSLVIYQLPKIKVDAIRSPQWGVMFVSVLFGIAMWAVSWTTMHDQLAPSISPGLIERSLAEANGRNVVNVILVDFRAFDTMGEILVLALAGLGVAALMARKRHQLSGAFPCSSFNDSLLPTAVRFMVPLQVLFSIYLLGRGHNLPGGGFIGGLVLGSAWVLRTMVSGQSKAPRYLVELSGIGLLVALGSAILPLFVGQPFFTGMWWKGEIWVPTLGTVKIGTPFTFDVGVYLVVAAVSARMLLVLLASRDAWVSRLANTRS